MNSNYIDRIVLDEKVILTTEHFQYRVDPLIYWCEVIKVTSIIS